MLEYLVNIVEPGLRPPFYQIAEHLWGSNCNIDSDGNSETPDDARWTELSIELRGGAGQRVDVDPISVEPLVLQVRSTSLHLAQEVARFIVRHCGGAAEPAHTRQAN